MAIGQERNVLQKTEIEITRMESIQRSRKLLNKLPEKLRSAVINTIESGCRSSHCPSVISRRCTSKFPPATSSAGTSTNVSRLISGVTRIGPEVFPVVLLTTWISATDCDCAVSVGSPVLSIFAFN